MNKQEIEKSLKHYLKKRISYTFSLLIAFLITGGFATASELNQEVLLSRIKEDREKLEKLLQENYKKEAILQKENLDILKEADFYVKPEKGSLFSMPYWSKRVKSVEKEWQGTVRTPTERDSIREKFNALQTGDNNLSIAGKYSANSNNLSSGWINNNTNYGNNANIYDVEAKLFILPVVKAPVVNTPTAPVVSFTPPVAQQELNIATPRKINVQMGAITVTAPTVTAPTVSAPATITAPTLAAVTVNEPNVAINIGSINVAGPAGLTLPSLTAPTVNVTTTVVTPEGIKTPELSVIPPSSPEAPTFKAFNRGRGNWLGGRSFIEGRMEWNRNILSWELNDTVVDVNSQAMFNLPNRDIYGKDKTQSYIIATTEGGVVRNEYKNIATNIAANGGAPSNGLGGSSAKTSPEGYSKVEANIFYSAKDEGALPTGNDPLNGGPHRNGSRYQQSWIFQGNPTIVKDMTIEIGSKDSGASTALFAQNSKTIMDNVDLKLNGNAIVDQLSTGEPYEVKITNTNISITGDSNSVLTTVTFPDQHVYWQSTKIDTSGHTNYGLANSDTTPNENFINFGGTKFSASTSKNTILYISPVQMLRWNGKSQRVPYPKPADQNDLKYDINSERYYTFAPVFGNIRLENTGGSVNYTGSGNVGIWVNSYVADRTKWMSPGKAVTPYLNLGRVNLYGDKNVGYYFEQNNVKPSSNGIFQGNIDVDVEIGTTLDGTSGGTVQIGSGNISGGSNAKSEKNVAVYVASGQRKEMATKVQNGYKHYFPGTLDFKVNTAAHPNLVGIANNSQIGYPYLENDPIKDFSIPNFNIKFGKYSKESIGLVAKNGTVIDFGGSTQINDNAETGAEENIMVYAEGVWFNPRKALTGATYDKEAYGRGESTTGQKYISDFNTTVNLKNSIAMGSIKSTALFAKDGAIINATGKDIIMNGYGSKAVLAYAVKDYGAGTIVDSNNTNANKQPDTTISVRNIIATADGTAEADKNTNIAAIAISKDTTTGTGNVSVNVSGKVDVHGVGAFARGDKATVTISGNNSSITSGKNSGLVAIDRGTVNFGGGIIEHKIDKQVPFYSASGAKLNFNGDTTINMHKGVVFYGNASDFSATTGAGRLYNGMNKVTVNLMDHGVNLGVFKEANLTWKGNTDTIYTNGIAAIPHVHALNTNNKWYSSSLENGTLTVEADVDRDNISSGSTRGDGFNDIQMERERVILQGGKTIKSVLGKGMILASNKDATSNAESGYTLKKGKFDISNGANSTTAAYVNFGHIVTEKTATDEGVIEVSKGVGAYGVNGSKIKNEGTVKVGSSDSTSPGIAIMALAKTEGKTETYGITAGKATAGSKWIEIENKGTIDITGDNAIGIYAKNNYTAAAIRTLSTIHNEAPIALGDNSKAIVIQTTNTEGATLTLKDSGTNQDIKVGKNGIGVYAEYSDIKFDGNYGIAIKDDGIALQAKGVGKVEQNTKTDTLNVEYIGAKDKTAMALAYTGTSKTDTFKNDLHLKITNTGNANTLVGIYASGAGTLTNNGNITAENDGTYGILSKGVDVVNTGTIKVGNNTSTDSNAVGIYVEDAGITTKGDKVVMQGDGNSNKPIGIYVIDNALTSPKTIRIDKGSAAMLVDGKKAIGIYLEGKYNGNLKLINNSDITLRDSAIGTDKRIAIVLKNSTNDHNGTHSKIIVGKNNIGIYNENSTLLHDGTLEVKHDEDGTQNIGIHNLGDGKAFEFKVLKDTANPGLIDVEGRDGTVGVSAETKNSGSGEIILSKAEVKVKATNMDTGKIPLGIYAKGKGLTIRSTDIDSKFTVSPNAVGVYLEGDDTSNLSGSHKYSLSSENTKDRVAIGTYFKGGSYATTTAAEKIEINSTTTATNTDGPIRPIGLFYGKNSTKNEANLEIISTSKEVIGMYGKDLTLTNTGKIDIGAKAIGAYFAGTNLTNKGEVNVAGTGAYGLYLNGGNSNTQAKITASAKNSVGVLVTGKSATFENKVGNDIISKGDNSIGVYAEKEAEFKNSGKLTSEEANSKSIGIFGDKAKITNALNATIESKNVAIYAKTSSTVNNTGEIKIIDGSGIVATDKTTVNLQNSGKITSTINKANGIIATDKTIVNLAGNNISLTGDKSTGIYSDKNSTVNLTSGNITIGKEGLGLYTNNGTVNLTSYTGTFTLGDKSVGIYSKASTVNGGTLKVAYNNANIGVGIFYDGGTVTNNTVVQHTGKNLVNILSKGVILTNTANQNVQENSLGIYADGGEVTNSGTITLTGNKSVGFYLNNGAKLKAIGTINGAAATDYKVGIYAKNGIVEGKGTYNFAVDNGVAMYLDDKGVNNFTGSLNMAGNSVSGKRAVGIYTTPSATARNINTNVNVTGKDSIGMLLSGNAVNGSTVNYGGTLDISSASSNKYGIGAMIQKNSVFTLGATGKVKIGGTNNIGFYVEEGGILQVTGGTVENTKDGTFAYLENGKLDFKAGTVPNINFLNVSVSGAKGTIQNATTVTVGTAGLQASNGARITNTSTGVINGKVEGAKALVAIGNGSKIENQGAIKLNEKESVAMYVNDNASATSSDSVEVGKNSVAYFAKDGGFINVSGSTKIGKDSSVFYINKGRINYSGKDIVLPNETTGITLIGTNTGVTAANFNGKSITVGEKATGIYVTGNATVANNTIQNVGKINVGKLGNGVYINNNNPFQTNLTLEVIGEEGIGIYSTKNGNLTYSGKIDSTTQKVKGIVHTGLGNTINTGDIKLTGNSSIGVYAEGGGLLENTNKIEVAKGTTTATAVGLYGKNQTTVRNTGSIKMLESAIGIYGENTSIINIGDVSNSGKNNNGIYAKNSDVVNSGPITLGDSSNGIYGTSTTTKTITNSGNVTVGNTESSAIFGAGKTEINNLGGTIKTGIESVGLATEEGRIDVSSATKFDIGESSTYIYTEKGTAINNANLTLSDYSIGMYTKEGLIQNKGNVKVGTSLVGGGNTKVSVGMAVEKGTIENYSTINVPDHHGVGMVATDGGTAINKLGATINANGELSYGMQATNSSTLINEGTINVGGKDARGMAATNNSKIINIGTVNITGEKAQGIFVDFGSEVDNKGGIINVNNSQGVGILTGTGGVIKNTGTIVLGVPGAQASKDEGTSQLQAGAITIKGPKAYIDNVEIQNSGVININGPLDLGTIKLGSAAGHIGTINAESFENGKFIVLPNAAMGTSKDMYTIQYLGGLQNVPNNGTITAISYSASFVADIQKDPIDHNITRIVLVKVPYTKLLAQTAAEEFGKGLDDLYKGLDERDPQAPKSSEQDIFDALRMISDKDQLGATFDMELRGNTYANVQRRMLDINENFSNSYENLKNSNLYARGRFKTGAIVTNGEAKDKNPAVENYKSKTTGLIVMKEKDFNTYGRSADVSLAFTETNFKFDYGSKEKVHSLQLGVGFENFMTDKNWKYSTRGEFTLNRHNMKRKIHLSNGIYENKGKYWSETVEWKNKLRYETGTSGGLVTAGIFGTFNLGYGKFNNIKENGDGAELEIKSKDMYMVRPGVGMDLALNHYTKGGKVSLVGIATAEYEAGKVYDGANQARIKKSKAGYYDLEKPKKIKDIYKVGAQLEYQTNAGHKIGIGVTREAGSVNATKYGVNAVYKF